MNKRFKYPRLAVTADDDDEGQADDKKLNDKGNMKR